ncbi:MAG: RNA-directed DNA polymerase [Clostridiaceae bacterium]|jgi:RNA-directed DNA polymerase|nr:RNA-directed DNA polymerase [Clostridiaceae bacterium]
MLEQLAREDIWKEFLDYKLSHDLLDRQETEALESFVETGAYLPLAGKIIDESYVFSIPERRELSKMGTTRKRVVYCFTPDDNMILKLLAYLLYRYDDCLAPNCYAFRREIGVRRAFTDLARNPAIGSLWCYKTDIRNYFNSIDTSILSSILHRVLGQDPPLLRLILSLIEDDRALWQGEILREPRGVMAGTPTSPFLANLYLAELDFHFASKGVIYARYSDDIIIFDSQDRLDQHQLTIKNFLGRYRLEINSSKEQLIAPGQAWSFLGFQYKDGEIDIAPATVRKLMGRIRRSARSLRRWMLRKEAEPERALAAFNRKYNAKFYSREGRDLCWSRWFFPLLTTDTSLRRIDAYMQQYQRYLVTGRHNKASYARVPYAMMKANGYRPLVAAYYKGRLNQSDS